MPPTAGANRYAGTSQVPSLGSFSVQMPAARRTLATASAGLANDIAKHQRLGVNLQWQQQAIGASTLTFLAGYTMGF